jgi:hypothetical protein
MRETQTPNTEETMMKAMTYPECVSAMRESLGDDVLVDDGASTWTLANLDDELSGLPDDTDLSFHGYNWDGTGCYRVNDDGTWGMRMLRVVPQ